MSMASSFAIAASVLAAAGTVYSGVQANQQAKSQAAVMRQQAERERLQAAADSEQFRDSQQRLMAKRRAIMGASGIDATSGSSLLASEDFAGEAELEALKIRNGGDVRATRLDQQAGLTAAKGKADMTGSIFRGGSLLMDAGDKAWGG